VECKSIHYKVNSRRQDKLEWLKQHAQQNSKGLSNIIDCLLQVGGSNISGAHTVCAPQYLMQCYTNLLLLLLLLLL